MSAHITAYRIALAECAAVVLFASGCATFTTNQTDMSYEGGSQTPTRQITTKVKVTTFFDSTSQLAQSKATQTDKTQSASLGSLNQSATSTNLNQLIGIIIESAVKGAKGAP